MAGVKVNPTFTFWFGVITTIMQGIASGTVHLSGLVPDYSIPYITGWLGLFVFINMTILTALHGFSTKQGPLAAPPTVAEARKIMKDAIDNGK